MRFPFTSRPFPRVNISPETLQEIYTAEQQLLHRTLQQLYDRASQSEVNQMEWKMLKHRENLTVYKERRDLRETFNPNTNELEGNKLQVPMLLAVGSVRGDLDDMMYGISNPTEYMMKIKSSYTHDYVLDSAVLATIIEPSIRLPFKSLAIKWCVKGRQSFMGSLMRFRDFVYLESTGFIDNGAGERIGYHLIHSIEIPDVPELHGYNFVRGKMSIGSLYHQNSEQCLGVFSAGFVNPLGDVQRNVAVASAVDMVFSSVWKHLWCAEMKKLTKYFTSFHPPDHQHHQQCCNVCQKNLKASLSKKSCAICNSKICARCTTPKKLSFIASHRGKVVHKTITVCKWCLRLSSDQHAAAVAMNELSGEDPFASYNLCSSLLSSVNWSLMSTSSQRTLSSSDSDVLA